MQAHKKVLSIEKAYEKKLLQVQTACETQLKKAEQKAQQEFDTKKKEVVETFAKKLAQEKDDLNKQGATIVREAKELSEQLCSQTKKEKIAEQILTGVYNL